MKKFFITCGLVALLGSFASCENAEYQPLDNSLYISEAYSGVTKNVFITKEGAQTIVSVRTAQPAAQQLNVELGISQSTLDWYKNRYKQDSLVMLDPSEYTVSTTSLTIEAGQTASTQILVTIAPSVFDKLDDDVQYVIPFTIKSVSPTGILVQEALQNFILVCAEEEKKS